MSMLHHAKKTALFCAGYVIDWGVWMYIIVRRSPYFEPATHAYKQLCAYATGTRVEPYLDGWISVSLIEGTGFTPNHPSMTETYSKIDSDRFYLGDATDRDLVIAKSKTGARGCWVTRRDEYTMPVTKFKAPFMTVRYINPAKGVHLFLDISKDYFYEGNELFSAGFIQRWLEYNERRKDVFSFDYSLELFDDDMKMIYINNTQFIRLLQDTAYEVSTDDRKITK